MGFSSVSYLSFLVILISAGLFVFLNKNSQKCAPNQLKVWMIGNRKSDVDSLQTVRKVFSRAGYCIVEGDKGEEWDVMWSQNSYFQKGSNSTKKQRQLINHFPTLSFLTNKM